MQKIRLYFSTLLLLIVAVSCAKEESLIKAISEDEITDNGNSIGEPLTITAYIDNGDTKTSYDEETTFSWTENDLISVQLYGIKEGDSHYNTYDQYQFKANSSSASSTFTTVTSLNTTIWAINDYAFYPKGNAYGTNTELVYEPGKGPQTVWLYQVITPDATKPMGAIPLIGRKQSAGDVTTNAEFSFKTAVGILKLTVTNIPASARKIKITSSRGEKLSGYFTFDEDCEIKMANKSVSYSSYDFKTILFTPECEGETRSFYFPIPTGTFESGFTVDLLDGSDGVLKTISTSKSVTIKRNELMILPEFSGGSKWSYLGKGYYLDNYLFGVAGGEVHVASGGKEGYYVTVDICQNVDDSQSYRLITPYKAAWEQLGVTAGAKLSDLNFRVVNTGETFATAAGREVTSDRDGMVFFYGNEGNYANEINGYFTIDETNHNSRLFHANWAGVTDNTYNIHSKVISYQDDGVTPACVQLAPRIDLDGNYESRHEFYTYDDVIFIVLPGCNPGAMVAGEYWIQSNSKFIITIEESDDLSKGNIMITRYRGTTANYPGGSTGATCDISGKCYGTYANGTMSFPGGQKFAPIDGVDGYYWSIYAGNDSPCHDEYIVFSQQWKNNEEIGKVFTRPRIGLGYGTESQLAARTESGSGQIFSAGDTWIFKH